MTDTLRPTQLSFEVGGDHALPEAATFRVSGALAAGRELQKGEDVRLVLTDADGQVVAAGEGYVRGIAFHEHRPKDGPSWTERKHAIKLED
jgi:hypothetical protein